MNNEKILARESFLLFFLFIITSMNSCAQLKKDNVGRTKFSRNIPKPDNYVRDYENVYDDDEEC